MRFMIKPQTSGLDYGQTPVSYDIVEVGEKGEELAVWANGVPVDELWGAHVIDSNPDALDNIMRVNKKYNDLLNRLTTGDADAIEVSNIFKSALKVNERDEFVQYYNNIDARQRTEWALFLDDRAQDILGIN